MDTTGPDPGEVGPTFGRVVSSPPQAESKQIHLSSSIVRSTSTQVELGLPWTESCRAHLRLTRVGSTLG